MPTEVSIIPQRRAVFYTTFALFPVAGLSAGDLAWATDRACFYRWNGAAWQSISISSRSGATAAIGAAADYPAGSVFQNTTTGQLYMQIGGAWVSVAMTPRRIFVPKTTEQVVFNSTAFEDDNELFIAVAAWDLVLMDIGLLISSDPAADFKFIFTAPAGATHFVANQAYTLPVSASNLLEFNIIPTSGVGDYQWLIFRAIYRGAAAAGTLQLRFAQGTAAVENVYLRAGSFFFYERVT